MGLFGKNDWNVIAIIFERKDSYQANGNRAKGAMAKKTREGAKSHPRTIYWAVFNQKRSFLEGEPGEGSRHVPTATLQKLIRELPINQTVQEVLSTLEKGDSEKLAKALEWDGYPLARRAQ